MIKSLIFFVLFGFALVCQAQQDTLIWSDEFDGSGAPDPTKWGYDLGTNSGWGNNEIQNYTNSTQNSRQEGGMLVIQAVKYGSVWNSARLLTRYKFTFTYGTLIFRAKLPAGIGTWPALWMLGANLGTAGWPACGEVDVMEHVGKDPGVVHSSLHPLSSSGATVNTKAKTVSNFDTEFHTYMVKWTADKMEFSIDSVLFYTYNPPVKTSSTWPFDKPCFIIMNIAMGGNWGSDPQYETGGLKNGIYPGLTSATMTLDYVRVYQPKSYPYGIGDPPGNRKPDKLNFFPNPTNGKFHLSLPPGVFATGTIFNVTGNSVARFTADEPVTEIDLSAFPKGIYCVRLQSEGKLFTKKLILE
jgi:beta-glucanase (GH16 family)